MRDTHHDRVPFLPGGTGEGYPGSVTAFFRERGKQKRVHRGGWTRDGPAWGSGLRSGSGFRLLDLLPGLKDGDSCGAQVRQSAPPESLRRVPAAGGITVPLTAGEPGVSRPWSK